MAITYKPLLVWRADIGNMAGNYTISKVDYAISYTPLLAFGVSMAAHSLCNVAREGRSAQWPVNDVAPGAGASIKKRANIHFRYMVDLSTHVFSYPDPIAADLEETPAGTRIKKSSVVTIVGYLETATGLTLQAMYGTYKEWA